MNELEKTIEVLEKFIKKVCPYDMKKERQALSRALQILKKWKNLEEEILKVAQQLWDEGADLAVMDKTDHYIRFRINLRKLARQIFERIGEGRE